MQKRTNPFLQYVKSSWLLALDNPTVCPEKSPDADSKLSTIYRSTLCKYDEHKDEMTILTLVPGGTAKSPFSYTLKIECDVWLLCNDPAIGNRIKNNKGIVEYRLSVK